MTHLAITIALTIAFLFTLFLLLRTKKDNQHLTKQIRDLNVQNRASVAKKTNFLATASHDLQQPHQALGLFLASINTKALDFENARIINRAKDAHTTTSRLLNQLLDISRLD